MLRGKQDLDSLIYLSQDDLDDLRCPLCCRPYLRKISERCSKCRKTTTVIRCERNLCDFSRSMCIHCDAKEQLNKQPSINTFKQSRATNPNSKTFYWVFSIIVLLFSIVFFIIPMILQNSSTNQNYIKLVKKLREEFPSQRNETWYHVLSVLDETVPSVKSIVFLHGEDKRTPDCLTNKLVLLSSGHTIKSEEVTFSSAEYEGEDYGFALEHYRSVIEKFRIFVTDLTAVPGNIARIFHSLCDEVSSDIKPSLFIFTLKYDKSTEKLKPIERATIILRKNWSDLPDNEIFPLLTRITKNVVEILPEKQLNC